MLVRVLGSGGDGGVPRWDCACPTCQAVRAHRAPRRTHASLALSADGERWLLLAATPDVLRQLQSFDALHPKPGAPPPLVAVAIRSAAVANLGGLRALASPYALAVYGGGAAREAVANAAPANAAVRDLPLGEAVPDRERRRRRHRPHPRARRRRTRAPSPSSISEPAVGRVVVVAPELPDGARLPPEAVAAACVFVDAAAAPRLPPNPPPCRYLIRVAHDDVLLDRAAPPPPWPLAEDGLDLFV